MAIKTFSAGEVLTASDTNTFLANSGLVYVTSGTLSTNEKKITSCFSSNYSNYRIVLDSLQLSANADIYFQFLVGSTPTTSANYTWAMRGLKVNGASMDTNNGGSSQCYSGFTNVSAPNTIVGSAIIDVMSPQLTQRTLCLVSAVGYDSDWYSRQGMTHCNLTTAFDGIMFTTLGAPTMGGNYTVYGYRKA